MAAVKNNLYSQMQQADVLEQAIRKNLEVLSYGE